MYHGKVDCPDYQECGVLTDVSIEWESMADESEHKTTCCGCGKTIKFKINYSPSVCDEEFV